MKKKKIWVNNMKKLKLKIKKQKELQKFAYAYKPEDQIFLDCILENQVKNPSEVVGVLLPLYKEDRRLTSKKMQFFKLGDRLPEYSKKTQVLLFDSQFGAYETQLTEIFVQHFLLDFYYLRYKCRINNGITHFMLLHNTPEF